MRSMRSGLLFIVVLAMMLMAGVFAHAQEDIDLPINLEGIEVEVGGIVLVWSSVTMALVQVLKAIKWRGEPLLKTAEQFKLAAIIVGSIGIILSFALSPGATIMSVLAKGIPAILGALGLYDLVGQSIFAKKAEDAPGTS